MKWLFIFVGLLSSCDLVQPSRDKGLGFGAGFTTAKAIEKLQEIYTPEFDFFVYPNKICERVEGDVISCVVVPCELRDGEDISHCVIRRDVKEFWEDEKKVESLETSLRNLATLVELCKRFPEKCRSHVGKFKNKTLVLIDNK